MPEYVAIRLGVSLLRFHLFPEEVCFQVVSCLQSRSDFASENFTFFWREWTKVDNRRCKQNGVSEERLNPGVQVIESLLYSFSVLPNVLFDSLSAHVRDLGLLDVLTELRSNLFVLHVLFLQNTQFLHFDLNRFLGIVDREDV